ncbi:aromatic ring-hydroxylating oxygenase subunit alpha [Rhodovibrionaceae bacterium A322]
MSELLSDLEVIDRIFDHADAKTTDLGDEVWREPIESYMSQERFDAEIEILRRVPVPFCPSSALPEAGSYVARTAAGTPLVLVRGKDGVVRGFRNACRHRGMPVAEGTGCSRTLVCPYHAWTYGLDGKLLHVAGDEGFPGLDKEAHGLKPVTVEERGGLVFVTQDAPLSEGALEDLPELVQPGQKVFDTIEFEDDANWKLLAETSMEGYHIKALHKTSFYPYGYDNLNIVETYGPNSRIIFPFKRVEKLRDIPREERRIDGMVTAVYQLFPNTHISVLSNHSLLIIMEPLSPTRTKWVIYRMSNRDDDGTKANEDKTKKDAKFVVDSGLNEDRAAAVGIQSALESKANSHVTFGRYEKAIVHFHQGLSKHLALITNRA